MANRSFPNKGSFYTMHAMPVLLDCNFIVDSTNSNGLGIRSLKGPGVKAVYMHTSATAAAGNPNPAAGVIMVQFEDNYHRYYGGFSGQVSPVGTPVTSTVNHTAYVITALGTATLAQWQAAGVPQGIVPAVGVAFIATATATVGGAATVAPSAAAGSGIDHIEVLGDVNTELYTNISAAPLGLPKGGGQIILQCFLSNVLTAPTDGSAIGLSFYLSNSSVQTKGE